MNVTFMAHVIRSVRTLQDPIHVPVLAVIPGSLKEDVSQMKVTNWVKFIYNDTHNADMMIFMTVTVVIIHDSFTVMVTTSCTMKNAMIITAT